MPTTIDASFIDSLPPNVAVQFLERVAKSAQREAFRYPEGDAWKSVSWKQAGEDVSRIAAGLLALGVQAEQRVGIVSGTRYEWILADLGIMCAAAATTTVYPSTNEEDTAYILSDSECQVVFAEDDAQIAKLTARKAELPAVHKVVTFDGTADGDWVISIEDLEKLGDAYLAEHPGVIEATAKGISGDQLATLIYTSGTTGRPKGVRLRHSSWVYEGEAIRAQDILSEDDLEFRWLPMAHSFGKVLMSTQMAIGFSAAIDGRVDKIIDNLAVVKPTFMGAAPRIFEKAHGRIMTMQAAEGGLKERIFNQAFKVGLQVEQLKREGKSVPLPLSLQHTLFDQLVFSKIRDRFGGRVRFFISGAAALNRDIAEWFHAAGIVILEGYGLTETTAGSLVNRPDATTSAPSVALPGHRVQDRRRRRGDDQGPRRDGRLPQPPRGDCRGAHRGRLVPDRRHRRGRRRRLRQDHRPQEGPLQDLRRQVHRAVHHRDAVQGGLPLRQPVPRLGNERNFVSALITLDPDAIPAGPPRTALPARLRRDRHLRAAQGDGPGLRRRAQRRLNRWETIKKFALLDRDLTVE